jgi:TPP-dependent pyruvate/acetoin dehydrogenase alpha subunit
MGTALAPSESVTDLCRKAAAYDVPAEAVDGMDVVAVEEATRRAAAAVRSGPDPYFLELRTYRFRAHSMFDPERYRDKGEVEEWKHRDPIESFAGRSRKQKLLSDEDRARIEAEIAAEVEDAVAVAEAGTWEPVEDLTRFVYSEEGRA